MTAVEFGQVACPEHRGDPYTPPWIACRFAHLCDACARIVEDAVLGDLRPVADAHRLRSRLAVDWDALHAQWDETLARGQDPRKVRLDCVQRIAEADQDLAGAISALSHRWDAWRPYAVEDVLYVLDPPLGCAAGSSGWKLAARLVAFKVQAGEIQAGRDPSDSGILLPESPWLGRFFMIQDVPDPDRELRTVARYVEVTSFVRVLARSAGKVG